jgi:hypothetical protein
MSDLTERYERVSYRLEKTQAERDTYRDACENLRTRLAAAEARAERLAEALDACRSFFVDPEGFAGVTISDTVWVRDGMTLLDWIEGALQYGDAADSTPPHREPGGEM